jgi:hypothetical protein
VRTILAAVAVALLTLPAYSQGMGGPKRPPQAPEHRPDSSKKKVDDKAYNDAVSRIRTPDAKPDPWKNVR